MITWGTNPGQGMPITGAVPDAHVAADEKALRYMELEPGKPLVGKPIDVVFVGSCTNGRIADLRQAARILDGRHVAKGVRTLVVPGSYAVKRQAEAEGLDRIFLDAGAEWREPGCSMCIAMNGDQLEPGQYAVSTSNRNFEGRQGKGGRTFLASPLTAAAAAVTGRVTDPRALYMKRRSSSSVRACNPLLRRRRRHRSDHSGALSQDDRPRGAGRAALRRLARRRASTPPATRACCSPATTSAAARRASTRVWALADFGFAAVIARSFADIFRANSLKNGLVPVAVDANVHKFLVDNPDVEVTVDVARAMLVLPDGEEVAFPLDPFARRCLTEGIDELEYLRRHDTAIAVWEARHG